jgi:hypothetical protein
MNKQITPALKRLCKLTVGTLLWVLLEYAMPGMVMGTSGETTLSSENIACQARRVAESTRTTGYCYAAVSRALHPLGVALSGAAAYEARAQLLKDRRFMPLTIQSISELRRGDIIVYEKSSAHPYGHISIYQGNYTEASDHLAPITRTQAYGGATVFRLRSAIFAEQPAPDFAPDYTARNVGAQNQSTLLEAATRPHIQASKSTLLKKIFRTIRRAYSASAVEPLERSLLRQCERILFHE